MIDILNKIEYFLKVTIIIVTATCLALVIDIVNDRYFLCLTELGRLYAG